MPAVTFTPTPHFVVKTRLLQPSRLLPQPPLTKVFINVCDAPEVPAPPTPFEPSTTFELIMNDSWEVPIATSHSRADTDKKGDACVVFDCAMNTAAMRSCQQHNQLREIVIEWCLESVEVAAECVLDREKMSIPKMVSKGTPLEMELHEEKTHIDGVHDLLEVKRGMEDEESEVGLEALMPEPSKQPLIQEIEDMSLDPKPARTTPTPQTSEPAREKLQYTTTMHKTSQNGYALQITITSQNTSSLDYDLTLDRTTNTLILKNTNPRYTAKDLELPLPTVFEHPQIKSFFVAPEKKLVVFVK